MDNATATLQKLLYALDDTSTLYRRLLPRTSSSHLRLLLERAVTTHQGIAQDLAVRMTAIGGDPERGGSLPGRLRALYANWQARASFDVALACAVRAEGCEEAVLRRCREAIACAMDGESRHCLELHHREIERGSMSLGYLGSLLALQAKPSAPSQRNRKVAHLAQRRTVRHGTARDIDRVEA